MESYVERPPPPGLARVVRTVWIQRTGATPYVQRHLPTGGVEIHVPIGGRPQLLGPLTGPMVEVIPPRTTVVGVRFRPGAAPPLPAGLDDLVDRRLDLADLWGEPADHLGDSPGQALRNVQTRLRATRLDPLVGAAVRALMPWRPVTVDALAARLALSPSQLRRRVLHAVGLSPKALQRTLRFQGFLALAQAGATAGAARLAVDAGYADQAHLGRECVRLTGLTPRAFLSECTCGHDHSASYAPFLRLRDSFKTSGAAAPTLRA